MPSIFIILLVLIANGIFIRCDCPSIHHCVKSNSDDNSCTAVKNGLKTDESTMALVPYDANKDILAIFNKPERVFHFVGKEIKIPQDWNNLGVAAVVWDAAIVLSEYLEAGNVHLEGKRVLELGAGSGLVGIVATLLGAQTILTDQEKAIPYLTKVATDNLPQDLEGRFEVRALDWQGSLESYRDTFDVILGADIIYIEDTFPDLLRTIEHLSNEDTFVYISCRIRYTRDSNFLKMFSDVYELKKVHVDKQRDITIYKGRKKTK
ncbi:protein N-lysine methyltransferase METTL21A-like [Saccostrea echinata]|uniref:protein N-lysine methyltransferase METTL21A-like n=1 Tax=Saccostrea echinata TaxID=191078 RepID=UPI002A8269D7|nr:protein N-lysine methyltransferase METTL21A-like [Saccostrea echinata]